jgi:SpoVK/Ycf46/Vps4 family AAA+-type ATPase
MLAVKPSDTFDCHFNQWEKLVSALFALARCLSPYIIFIDEINPVFSQRSTDPDGVSAGRAHHAVMTEFMQEMDGLVVKSKNVVVIGATDRPFDLGDALLRRLPLRLLADLPGERAREGRLHRCSGPSAG